MRCLLIAPASVFTISLYETLQELGADEVVETGVVGVGADLARADLGGFDFAVAVSRLDDRTMSAGMTAVLVEIGIALGQGLPVFVISESGAGLPPALAGLPSATISASDVTALRLHLSLFVRGLDRLRSTERAIETSGSERTSGSPLSQESLRRFQLMLMEARDVVGSQVIIERVVVEALRDSGAVVEQAQGDDGVDGAFVVPGEELTLGSVLYEVKSSSQFNRWAWHEAQERLLEAVLSRGGGMGLLFFDRQFRPTKLGPSMPLVVTLSIDQFLYALSERPLAAVLRMVRNEAVHSL